MHKAPTNPIMMWEIVQLPHPWVVSQTKCKCIAWNNGRAATACKIYILDKKGSPRGSSFSSIKNKLYFEFPIFNRKASLSNAENKMFPAEFPESVLNKPSGKDPPKGWRQTCSASEPLCPVTLQSQPLCRPVQALHLCIAGKCI